MVNNDEKQACSPVAVAVCRVCGITTKAIISPRLGFVVPAVVNGVKFEECKLRDLTQCERLRIKETDTSRKDASNWTLKWMTHSLGTVTAVDEIDRIIDYLLRHDPSFVTMELGYLVSAFIKECRPEWAPYRTNFLATRMIFDTNEEKWNSPVFLEGIRRPSYTRRGIV